MLNKNEFKKLVSNKTTNIDNAYKLYKSLHKEEHIESIKAIIKMSDRELISFRNIICSQHLVEMSPDEIRGLKKVLEVILENHEE